MAKVVTGTMAIFRSFGEIADHVELLGSDRSKVRFLVWLIIGLTNVNVIDNMKAVEAIYLAVAGDVRFEAGGELVQAGLNGAAKFLGSVLLSGFILLCESFLILGVRMPSEAHQRLQEAQKYRAANIAEGSPTSAKHWQNAVLNGEMFDIWIAMVLGGGCLIADGAVQYQNRLWDGSAVDILFNLGAAIFLMVGTELLTVMIRVIRGRRYPENRQSATRKQGGNKKSQQSPQWGYMEKDGIQFRYNSSGDVQAHVQGQWVTVTTG